MEDRQNRRVRRGRRRLAALLPWVVLGLACNPMIHINGGYMEPFSERSGRDGVAVDAHLSMHSGDGDQAPSGGGGLAFRTKFAESLLQIAIAEEFFVYPFDEIKVVTPYLRGGFNVFQFESLDDSFGFGMFSPYGELGFLVRVWEDSGDSFFLSFSGLAEHDLRFTDQPNESYWAGLVGFGFSGRYVPPGPPPDEGPQLPPANETE